MIKSLIILFLVFTTSVFAQTEEWTRISPLDYCPEYQIEFKLNENSQYDVRIPELNNPEEFISRTIPNINDLSVLTDDIVVSSTQICNRERELVTIESGQIIFREEDEFTLDMVECYQPYKFSAAYLDLMRDLVEILQLSENANRCDQVADYIELQTKISQLREEELVEYKSSRNLFHLLIKLFAGDDTDDMVDLYNTCGGKKGSDLFVTNSILLVARDSCIMPKPPGILSFEQAQNIARSVGSEFRNLSLMKLNKRKDRITRRATMAFVDSVIKEEVNGLIGPYVDNTDEFVSSLNSYQELQAKKLDDEQAMDYISYGFSIDATVEVASKSIPYLIENSFKDKLPETWDADKRKAFIEEKILPSSYEKYQACIQPYLDRIGYGKSDSLQTRLGLKEEYCAANPSECDENSCTGSVNLMSGDPNTSDSQVVQGCVMESIFTSIKPLLNSLIVDQKEAFKDDFELTDEKVEIFTERTWDKLVQCSTKKVLNAQRLNPDDYSIDEITHNRSLLQNTMPNDFEAIVGACAEVAETSVSRDFVSQLLLNQPDLMNTFQDDELIERDGQMYPKALVDNVDGIIRGSFDVCLAKQNYIINVEQNRNSLVKTNPLLCTPHVEMAAAKLVIEKSLKDTIDKFNLNQSSSAFNALSLFNSCAREAITNAQNAIGANPASTLTPINNESDATSYLEKNNDFYNCTENGIVKIAEIVTEKSIENISKEMAGQIQNISYLNGLKDDAANIVSSCFRNKLQREAGNWKKFGEFNAAGGLDSMQVECEKEATEYVLPKIIVKETGSLLLALKSEGVIKNNTEVGNIIARAAYDLRQKYGISLPSGIKSSEIVNYSLAKAYSAHMQTKGNSIDSFISEYESITMSHSVDSIHDYLRAKVNQRVAPQNYNDFFQAVSPECITKLYSKFKPEITEFIDDMNSMPSDPNALSLIDTIIETVVSGVQYSKALGSTAYANQKNKLKQVCRNMNSYSSPRQLAATGAFDFIIKSNIQKEVITTFEDLAVKQCREEIKSFVPSSTASERRNACRWSDPYNQRLARDRILQKTSTRKNEIPFIYDRFDKMKDVIADHLKYTRKFNQTMFRENPSPIINYVYDNFSDVMTNKTSVKNRINGMVTEKLFADMSSTSFADDFAEVQLVSGLGIAGYSEARDGITVQSVDSSVGGWDWAVNKNKVVRKSKAILQQKWNPTEISRRFNWSGVSYSQRRKLITAMYNGNVRPAALGQAENSDLAADAITSHVEDYKYSNGKSFSDSLSDDIAAEVKSNWGSILGIE